MFTKSNFLELHAAEAHGQSGGGAAKRPRDDALDEQTPKKRKLEKLMTLKTFMIFKK